MFRLVAMCSAIVALTFETLPASAAIGDTTTYDTVDAFEVFGSQIKVTGIISGHDAPSTALYTPFIPTGSTSDIAARCDRLALVAMSRPGKFQFAVMEVASLRFSCKLIVRTP